MSRCLLLLFTCTLSACGLKGPLYLPERSEPVVVIPPPVQSVPGNIDSAPASTNEQPTAEQQKKKTP